MPSFHPDTGYSGEADPGVSIAYRISGEQGIEYNRGALQTLMMVDNVIHHLVSSLLTVLNEFARPIAGKPRLWFRYQ